MIAFEISEKNDHNGKKRNM